ncbi:hypothetical protein P8452_01213 [Trifolium repens]|nr:hypothetical protein P8452_01213 [Trifolium repens]
MDEEEETLVLFCRRLLIAAPESFSASTLPSYPSGSLMQFTATSDDVLCSGYDSVFHYNDYDLFYKKFLMRDLKRDMVTMNILIH